MAYTLTQLAADIRETLKADPGPAAKEKVCGYVSKSLTDSGFVATHLKDRAPGANPREVLYEDPELGFCICGHVYGGPAHGSPHDHGSSWAIYGQAAGIKTYAMKPGDAHLYDVGAVHSPNREAPVKLVRIEGKNLDHVKRSNIKAK